MDVYWINCLLACTLSVIMGYWLAERKYMAIIRSILMKEARVASVTSDVNLH